MIDSEKISQSSPISDKIHNIIKLDKIRITKLFEIVQYSLIGFFIGYVIAGISNDYILVKFDKSNYITDRYPQTKDNRNPKLLIHMIWDLSIIVIFIYYIRKISVLIPFIPDIFNIMPNGYITGKSPGRGEDGFIIGLGFIFSRELYNLTKKIDLFIDDDNRSNPLV